MKNRKVLLTIILVCIEVLLLVFILSPIFVNDYLLKEQVLNFARNPSPETRAAISDSHDRVNQGVLLTKLILVLFISVNSFALYRFGVRPSLWHFNFNTRS